jgi:SAM-dependent methyltransferase
VAAGTRYDGLADWYDGFVRAAGLTAVELDVLERLLGRGPGRCLDLGCGTGVALATLAGLGWSTVGVDVSADQLRVARERADTAGAELVLADAAAMPFENGSFDAVASLVTHTDFEDAAAVFAETARVLRPGGRLVYVGVHPCFVAPTVERRVDEPHLLHPGYRRRGWWHDAPGFRLGREGVRGRAGVNHLPLADFLNAVLDAGLRPERFEEPGEDDYPLLLAFRAYR